MGSKRSRPRGQRLMHSPQVRQRLSFTGSPSHTWRLTSISMGQLNEQTPHWTQRIGSGKTHAVARAAYFSLSELNQPTVIPQPSLRYALTRTGRGTSRDQYLINARQQGVTCVAGHHRAARGAGAADQ